MSPKEAARKLKEGLAKAPKVKVRNGKVEIEREDGRTEEVSEIQKHEFKACL